MLFISIYLLFIWFFKKKKNPTKPTKAKLKCEEKNGLTPDNDDMYK